MFFKSNDIEEVERVVKRKRVGWAVRKGGGEGRRKWKVVVMIFRIKMGCWSER